MRTIGFLNSGVKGRHFDKHVDAFRQGLKDAGCVEGKDVKIVFEWAHGNYPELPKLAAKLVKRKVDVIAATGGTVAGHAAAKATKTIPVLFVSGFSPSKAGLMKGRNTRGVHVPTTESVPKRLAKLRQLAPKADKVAVLLRPGTFVFQREKEHAKDAGLIIVQAKEETDFPKAFKDAIKKGAQALIVCADPYFTSHRKKLIVLAAEHRLPTAYPWREYPEEGGLMSFGPNLCEAYRHVGEYAGNIIRQYEHRGPRVKKNKISDFELVVNARTAQQLGLSIPERWKGQAQIV